MPRKRSKRLLLFPFLIPIFVVGWIMYIAGEPHSTKVKASQKHVQPAKGDLKMGLLEEVAEPQVAR